MPVVLWWDRIRSTAVSSVVTLGWGLYAVAAVPLLLYAAVTCVVGIGFALVPPQLWLLGRISDAERKRLGRLVGNPESPVGRPYRWLPALALDRTVWRELRWAVVILFAGTLLGAVGVALVILPVLCFASIWLWWLFPPDDPIRIVANIPISGWWSALTLGTLQTVITTGY